MKYFFTIIIPHKNIPNLLQRCLDSIPQREDLQIVVVDDNSNPEKVDFSHFPGLDMPNCKVIFTTEGKGAGYARNVGLNYADSKWVLFADADDFYSKNLNEFLDRYKDTDYQTVYFYNDTIDNETLEPVDEDKFVESLVKEGEAKHNMDCLRYKAYAPWTKMTQVNFIRKYNLKFQEIKASNDSLFNVKVGHFAENFDIYKNVVYLRTICQSSLSHTINIENNLARLECGYSINKFLKQNAPEKIYEFHSETWGHFCDLRKVSWWLFFKVLPAYFYKTPKFILFAHFQNILGKYVEKIKKLLLNLPSTKVGIITCILIKLQNE